MVVLVARIRSSRRRSLVRLVTPSAWYPRWSRSCSACCTDPRDVPAALASVRIGALMYSSRTSRTKTSLAPVRVNARGSGVRGVVSAGRGLPSTLWAHVGLGPFDGVQCHARVVTAWTDQRLAAGVPNRPQAQPARLMFELIRRVHFRHVFILCEQDGKECSIAESTAPTG